MMFTNSEFNSKKVSNLFPKIYFDKWINNRKEYTYKKGDLITTPEKLINNIFIIKNGNASEFHIYIDGKECVIGLLSSGDIIGFMNVFTKKKTNTFSKALTDVTVVSVSKEEIRELVEQNPSISMGLLNYFSEKHADMVETLEQIAYGKVENRLVFLFRKFVDLTKEKNGWYPIPVSITHKDIAGMIASTRETVTATINKLLESDVIRYQNNTLWIQLKEKDEK